MTVAEFIHDAVRELDRASLRDVRELTPEHLRWTPAPQANPIWFLFLHLFRSQDNVIHRTLQGQPLIWDRDRWHERTGLDERAQGTGLSPEDIAKMTTPPLEHLLAYATQVMEATLPYLQTLDEAKLSHVPNPERAPGRTVGQAIYSNLLGHGYWHLGEIRYIKGLQGMPFPA